MDGDARLKLGQLRVDRLHGVDPQLHVLPLELAHLLAVALTQPVQLADAIRVAYCQPAVGAYFPDPEAGVYRPYGLMVLTLDGESVAEITGCTDPAILPLLQLPTELEM